MNLSPANRFALRRKLGQHRRGGGTVRAIRSGFLGAALLALALSGCERSDVPVHLRIGGADPDRGQEVIRRIGCGVCHHIPGIRGARGTVGPSLEGFAGRSVIGGIAGNRPEVLIRWVRNAPSIAPATAMPALPLSEAEARDVAAYLYTLD